MPDRAVRDVIGNRKPLTASGKTTVAAAAGLMKQHQVGAIMVVAAGRLVGIFTERDAVFRVLAEGRDPRTTTVAAVMTEKPRTIDAAGFGMCRLSKTAGRSA